MLSFVVSLAIWAQLRRGPPIMPDPFLTAYDPCGHSLMGSGSFGDVQLVRRKGTSTFFAAKYIDPKARKYGSDSQELDLLRQIDHECVVNKVDAYEPYFPASPRDPSQPDLKIQERRQLYWFFRRTTWI